MTEVASAEALLDCGLQGDRYTDARLRKSPDYQVTLIESESIDAFTSSVGAALAPSGPRRNLVTAGVDLNSLLGRRFVVGEAELEGLELCEPCSKFAKRTHPEVIRFLVHRGGLRARILRGGRIRVGDPVEPVA